MTKKNVLCAWSGGLDSTAMIYRYLQKGWHVDALTVNIINNAEQNERENIAINAMLPFLEKYDFTRLQSSNFEIKGSGVWSLAQAPIWITSLLYAVTTAHNECAIGYVSNDDAISFLHDINKAWISLGKVLLRGPVPRLVFPVAKVNKIELYNLLTPELQKHISWCAAGYKLTEDETAGRGCGICHSCLRMKYTGLWAPKEKFVFPKLDDPLQYPF